MKYAPPLLSSYPKKPQRSTKVKDIIKETIRFPKLVSFQYPASNSISLFERQNCDLCIRSFDLDKNSTQIKIKNNNKLRFKLNSEFNSYSINNFEQILRSANNKNEDDLGSILIN